MAAGRHTLVFAAMLLLAAATAVPAAAEWSNCATGSPVFSVSDVTLVPSPVKPGDTANFTIVAKSAKAVGTGQVQMIVKYAGVPIWTQLDDLCDKAACPISAGPTEVHYSQPFPAITPPGYYSVTLDGHAGTEQLFCVRVDFQVVIPSAAQVARAWEGALGTTTVQQVLTTHRKQL
ncbi:Phosphatidylglycerol/phosphatidylinositol transfer protein [Chlorella vulgaris]